MVELRRVSKVFAGTTPVTALAECNLVLHAGEFVSISGPSGSGKSTLLSVLGLLDTPSSGDQLIDGLNVKDLRDRDRSRLRARSIGFVFQDASLISHRTVIENVSIGLMYGGFSRRLRKATAATALEQVSMTHRLGAAPSTLSGGERQRVAIARAISRSPRVILADEPTGNLDHTNSMATFSLLQDLNRKGHTIVLVTHDRDLAGRCGRRYTMMDGRLSEGPSDILGLTT